MMDQCPLHRVRAQRAEASRLPEVARCAIEEVEVLQGVLFWPTVYVEEWEGSKPGRMAKDGSHKNA